MLRRGHLPCLIKSFVFSSALLVFADTTASAQDLDRATRRLRGIIDKDETWSDRIMITDHLKILGATVTVLPGTIIEFSHARPGNHPILTVGSEHRGRGELVLQATSDRPIILRSRSHTNPGRMILYLRNRITTTLPIHPRLGDQPKSSNDPANVEWRHVRIENLGCKRTLRSQSAGRHDVTEPSITFHLVGTAHSLHLADCEFDQTTRMVINADDDSKITVENNRFKNSLDRAAIEIEGSQINKLPGKIVVSKNRAGSAIVVDGAPVEVRENILIGLNASIVVREPEARQVRIIGNYVHNSTTDDDGRYCFDTSVPDVAVNDNIFRGGTTCVLNGAVSMCGNVLIGEPNLDSPHVKKSQTHQLVASLPPGADFRRNLLIGPAHSLLIPQPFRTRIRGEYSGTRCDIANNVFDGLGATQRAIHINPSTHVPTKIGVVNNLFIRSQSLIYDDAGTSTAVNYADCNAYAPMPSRGFESVTVEGLKQGEKGWSSRDVVGKDISELGLHGRPFERIPDFDADIASGKLSVEQLRLRLFDVYRPRRNSPLAGAGCPLDQGKRQSIGASEPLKYDIGGKRESPQE